VSIPQRLTVVTVGARDLPALRRFYEGLGWEPRISAEDFVAFEVGGLLLGLYEIDKLAQESRSEVPPAGTWSGWALACNADTREGVDALWQAWVDAGATPVAEPVDLPYGPRAGYVADPEGNRWEIAWAEGVAP
jgi:predicted lactoylglutathione lyase